MPEFRDWERWLSQWSIWCKHQDLSLDPQHHVRSWAWHWAPVIPALGRLRKVLLWHSLAGQLTQLNPLSYGSTKDLVSKIKTEHDWRKHLTSTSDLHVNTHKSTSLHVHMNVCITHTLNKARHHVCVSTCVYSSKRFDGFEHSCSSPHKSFNFSRAAEARIKKWSESNKNMIILHKSKGHCKQKSTM